MHVLQPGKPVDLAAIDPAAAPDTSSKAEAKDELRALRKRLDDLQERLYAARAHSVLLVLQAMDTGGKDSTIRAVLAGVNPQGCRVWSFGVPSAEEAAHDYLWRVHRRCPPRGFIGVFNRSHYEDVLVVRVKELAPESAWRPRYDQINAFEAHLAANGTTLVKCFLHISHEEQRRRLQDRLDRPDKHWKFSAADVAERELWDGYQAAYAEALERCTTAVAPWHVVPADRKWYRNLVVARALVAALEAIDPRFPPPADNLDEVELV